MSTVKFRHSATIAIAGLVAFLGALPIATASWFLTPVLLIPLGVGVWGWRAGTDANADGLVIRGALFGRRRLPWSSITGFVRVQRRVIATLNGGVQVSLPAVTPGDLPRLIAASGQTLDDATEETAANLPSNAPNDVSDPAPAEVQDHASNEVPDDAPNDVTQSEPAR